MELIDLFNMAAGEIGAICGMKGIWGIAGWVITIIKVGVPILLIVIGMIDMTKAILSKSEDEIHSAQVALIKKVISGVMVFLIVTVVIFLFKYIVGFTGWQNSGCINCLNNPSSCKIE